MKCDFTGLSVVRSAGAAAAKAASLFCDEIKLRTGRSPITSQQEVSPAVIFSDEPGLGHDDYDIELDGGRLTLRASSLRGFIFAYSAFLRKTEYSGEKITLVSDISGEFRPEKRIRGHQLGYRPKNNTYDAWTPDIYSRYFRDMMMFNNNMCELMPGGTDDADPNELMKWEPDEMLRLCSEKADELDMDVCVWYPNCDKDATIPEAVASREKNFRNLSRIDAIFPPGGDPGDFTAKEFIERTIAVSRKLKEIHPKAEMWPSAQKPKRMPGWGAEFISELEKLPDEIDGVITGPNRAFSLEELRRRLPMKYPIRLYPDITHNVRCEYPVHFLYNDWHFALTSTLGRESINPRPYEFQLLHSMTKRYTVGSVSYSEGSNDDLNKMLWGWLEFDSSTPVNEILEDYSRAFLIGADPSMVAAGIWGLERNWYGDPAENPQIDQTLAIFREILLRTPSMKNNWRFNQLYFRANADEIVRQRRIFELGLIKDALKAMRARNFDAALAVLETPFPEEYDRLRAGLFDISADLFDQIGMQLDVEHFHASAAERGAVLETIDLPVTDRKYYLTHLNKFKDASAAEKEAALAEFLDYLFVKPDEYFFSVAVDGMERFGGTPIDAYKNFRGDRPNHNTGEIPVEYLSMFDYYYFACEVGGFEPGTDYNLQFVTNTRSISPDADSPDDYILTVNGAEIFRGSPKDIRKDPEFDAKWLGQDFISINFDLPASVFQNGCVSIKFGQSRFGVEIASMRITKKK